MLPRVIWTSPRFSMMMPLISSMSRNWLTVRTRNWVSFCLRMPAERSTFSWARRLATVVMGMLSRLSFCSSMSMWISSSSPPEMEQAATPSVLSRACLTSFSAM